MTKKEWKLLSENFNTWLSDHIVLNDYQQQCLTHFSQKYQTGQNRFLFGLKMGLGKTYTALEFAKSLNQDNWIIICKPNLVNQWIKSYVQIFKKTNIFIIYQVKGEYELLDILLNQSDQTQKVFLVSYDRIKKVFDLMFKNHLYDDPRIKLNIILDESQVLKNHSSGISKMFLKMNQYFHHLLLLSGSLISNDAHQLFTQYKLLLNLHEKKYSFSYFVSEYFGWKELKISKTRTIMVPDSIILSKAVGLLNKLHEVSFFKSNENLFENKINYIQLQSDQTHQNDDLLKTLKNDGIYHFENFFCVFNTPVMRANKIKQYFNGYLYGYNVPVAEQQQFIGEINNQQMLMELEQYVNGISTSNLNEQQSLFVKNYSPMKLYFKDSLKLILLENFLNESQENFIMFYNEYGEKDVISYVAKKCHYQIFIIDSNKVSVNNLLEQVKQIIKKEKIIILIQTTVGSVGIDGLQHYFNNVIWFQLPFSYEKWDQANARVYRIGQKENVNIYYLTTNIIDEKIYERLCHAQDYNEMIWSNDITKLLDNI